LTIQEQRERGRRDRVRQFAAQPGWNGGVECERTAPIAPALVSRSDYPRVPKTIKGSR
jgi:hypothetical protein